MGGRRVRAQGAAALRSGRSELRRLRGDRADRCARGRGVVVDGRGQALAAPRRRRRRAPARVHDPRRRRAAPRRDRRAPPPDLVRRAPLAGGALHAGRVDRARDPRGGDRLAGRGRSRRSDRGPGRVAGLAGGVARAPRPRGDRLRACGRCARRPPAVRHRARPRAAARTLGGDAARRRSTRRDRDRGRRLGARLGRRGATRERGDGRVPRPRAGPDRLRRGGRGRAPAHPRAACTRGRRAARADLASPRRRFARAQPGPRGRGRHVPRCEPGARTLRGRLPLDARPRASTTRRRTQSRRPTSSPRISRSSCRCCTACSSGGYRERPRRRCGSPATSRQGRPSASWPCRARRSRAWKAGAATSRGSRSHSSARPSRLATRACGRRRSRRAGSSRFPPRRAGTTSGSARSSAHGSATTRRSRSATPTEREPSCSTGAFRSLRRRSRNWCSTSRTTAGSPRTPARESSPARRACSPSACRA